ncbi:hypothetical protein ABPG74_015925 [Tetrahymena malaccensis]
MSEKILRIFAWVQLFLFFFAVPDIIKYFWKDIQNLFPSDKYMFAVGLILINSFTYYGGSLIFMCIYKGEFKFFEQYKIIKNKKWPWNEDQESWKKIRNKTIFNSFLNLFVVGLGLLIIDLQINEVKTSLSLEKFPSKLKNLKDFCILLFFHDFCFYWSHRFFHQKFIYPYIHKIHHQYYQNVCIAGQYFHPLEFVITILLPTFMMVKYLGSDLHFSTLCMWIFVMGVNAVEEHSGYDFPWSPFNLSDYNVSAQFHDFHHSHNVGTFGAQFNFYDKLFKTDKEFKQFMESQQTKQIDKKIS